MSADNLIIGATVLCVFSAVTSYFALWRAMFARDAAEEARDQARLARDPLDAEKASAELLLHVDEAAKMVSYLKSHPSAKVSFSGFLKTGGYVRGEFTIDEIRRLKEL